MTGRGELFGRFHASPSLKSFPLRVVTNVSQTGEEGGSPGARTGHAPQRGPLPVASQRLRM